MKAPWFLLLFVNQSLPYISLDLSNTALKLFIKITHTTARTFYYLFPLGTHLLPLGGDGNETIVNIL